MDNDVKKGIKRLAKKNRYTVIAILIFLALIVVSFIGYKIFFPNTGTPIYGNRLDGKEAVDFTSEELSSIVDTLEKESNVVSATSHESGRTLNVIITVKKGTKSDDAKKLADIVGAKVTEEQKKYFDFQVFIKNENENESGYPMIGYKNKTSDAFSFSETKVEENN